MIRADLGLRGKGEKVGKSQRVCDRNGYKSAALEGKAEESRWRKFMHGSVSSPG